MIRCRLGRRPAHIADRWNSRLSPDHGSASVELVVLVPVLLLLLLIVAFVGRLSEANTAVRHAADQAARAASQVKDGSMPSRATEVALEELSENGVACLSPAVLVNRMDEGGIPAVSVTVSCQLNRQSLVPLAPGAQTVAASSVEVIDVHRGDGLP
jgi:TadE-like protein